MSSNLKVTIKAKDLERSKEADMWPFHVGVRMYKHYSTKPESDHMTFENQTTDKGINNIQPARRIANQKKPEEIEISNRFDPL